MGDSFGEKVWQADSAGRQSSRHGPQPLSNGDIAAGERLLSRQFHGWEGMLLKQLDLDYLEVQAMDDGALLAEQKQDDEARAGADENAQRLSGKGDGGLMRM